MDRLDELLAHAIPIWSSRLEEAREACADLSALVGIVLDDGGSVKTALCQRELAAARVEAFTAPTPSGLAADVRRATSPIAVAVIREHGGVVRARVRPLILGGST